MYVWLFLELSSWLLKLREEEIAMVYFWYMCRVVARAAFGVQATHPEDQSEEEHKEKLRKKWRV